MANSVIPLPGGIRLNSSQKGYLDIEEHVLRSLINTQPITSVYDVEQTPFARGKFASVKKCTSKETGVQYAAKFIRKRRRAMDHRQDILHEVAILKLASECSKIVTLHEVFETSMEMILVLELAAGGELQRIVDVQEGLGEAETIRILKQILLGLQFLHDRNIAHLDIKPQNILLTRNHPGSDIKLCDFGISRIIQSGVDVREILGTPDYIAPEILSYEPISLETDVWSIGVLAYVLLTGYSPFGGETKQETFCNISQCNLTFPEEFFSNISTSAQDFIMETLVTSPNERLSVSQCFNHPWLSGISTYSLTESSKILLFADECRQVIAELSRCGMRILLFISMNMRQPLRYNWATTDRSQRKTSSTSFQLSCLTCSQCNTITQCGHNNKSEKESSEKSQVMNGLKPPVDILLDRSILC